MKKYNFTLLYVLLGIFLVLGAIDYYKHNHKTPEPEAEASQWQVFDYKNYHFSLESPMRLTANKKALVDMAKVSKKLSLFADSPDQSLHLLVESQEYRGSVPVDHLDQFEKKVVGLFQTNNAFQNFQHRSSPVTFADQPGVEITGNYTNEGASYQFDGIEISRGNWSWDLEAVYLDQTDRAKEVQTIFQSFKLKD
jgi:hypothetical protein